MDHLTLAWFNPLVTINCPRDLVVMMRVNAPDDEICSVNNANSNFVF